MVNDLYKELKHQVDQHEYLYHYTNSDSASLILQNKSFKLNRLDKVNDQMENKRINSLWNTKIFVSCFTNSLNNEKMFYEKYGKIRLKIKYDKNKVGNVYKDSKLKNKIDNFIRDENSNVKNKNRKSISNWSVFNVVVTDVFYTDDINFYINNVGQELYAGLIKLKKGLDKQGHERNWEEEEETRIRVAVRPKAREFYINKQTNKVEYYKPRFTNLYIPIPGEIVDIEIKDGAFEEDTNEIKKLKEKYL